MLTAIMIAWLTPGPAVPLGAFTSVAACYEKRADAETILRQQFPGSWVECRFISGAPETSPIPKPKPKR